MKARDGLRSRLSAPITGRVCVARFLVDLRRRPRRSSNIAAWRTSSSFCADTRDAIGYLRSCRDGLGKPTLDAELDRIERDLMGPLPLSLRAFWRVVGSIDLTQSPRQLVDWSATPRSEVASLGHDDPLVVPAVRAEDFEGISDSTPDDHGRYVHFLSQDRFAKGNCSGGPGYGVWVPDARADFRVYNDICPEEEQGDEEAIGYLSYGQFFVRMLRDTMRGGGFRGPVDRSDDEFRPLPLRALQRQLAEGLLPI